MGTLGWTPLGPWRELSIEDQTVPRGRTVTSVLRDFDKHPKKLYSAVARYRAVQEEVAAAQQYEESGYLLQMFDPLVVYEPLRHCQDGDYAGRAVAAHAPRNPKQARWLYEQKSTMSGLDNTSCNGSDVCGVPIGVSELLLGGPAG